MGETLVQNQCSSCGAGIKDSSLKNCPNCGTLLDKIQKEINERNKQAEPCANCGSPVTFDIEKQLFVCDFCHSSFTTKEEREAETVILEADSLIPFQVSEGLAKKNFYEWLVSGKKIPADLLDKTENIQLEQLYIPYMNAQISYEGIWAADIGYVHSEEYTDYVTRKDSKGNSRTRPETKTRTVTDWRPMSDHFSGKAHKHYLVNDELTGAVANFAQEVVDLSSANEVKPFNANYTAGTRQLKISSKKVTEATQAVPSFTKEHAIKNMGNILPGHKNRNVKITKLNYTLKQQYTYIPFWKVTYQYEEQTFVGLITAYQKDQIQIDGNKPGKQQKSKKEKPELSSYKEEMKRKRRYALIAIPISFFLIGVEPIQSIALVAFFVAIFAATNFTLQMRKDYQPDERALNPLQRYAFWTMIASIALTGLTLPDLLDLLLAFVFFGSFGTWCFLKLKEMFTKSRKPTKKQIRTNLMNHPEYNELAARYPDARPKKHAKR